MRYYRLDADFEEYAVLGPRDESVWDFLVDELKRDEPIENWAPFEVELISEDDDYFDEPKGAKEVADLTDFNLMPICLFNEKAVKGLEKLIHPHGELLPVFGLKENFYILHVTETIDALDESRSAIERFSNGKIMDIKTYVIKAAGLAGDVFRMPGDLQTFVSERFVEETKKLSLNGFVFTPVELS